jgi:hypothetical protein
MHDAITVETELFEHREVKPHFINPCCFGEDFAAWLRNELAPLSTSGFQLSDIIQEDYGWGFWANSGKDSFWVALGYCDEDDPEQQPGRQATQEPPQWVVSIDYDPGLNIFKRLFQRPDGQAFARLRDGIRQSLQANSSIKIIENGQ